MRIHGTINARIRRMVSYITDNRAIAAHIKRDFGVEVPIAQIIEFRKGVAPLKGGVEPIPDESIAKDRKRAKHSSDALLEAIQRAG